MNVVREENRLWLMFEEVLENISDEVSSGEKSDHCCEQNLQSDSEQDISFQSRQVHAVTAPCDII